MTALPAPYRDQRKLDVAPVAGQPAVRGGIHPDALLPA